MSEAEGRAAAPSSPSGWRGKYFSTSVQTEKARLVKTFTFYDPRKANEGPGMVQEDDICPRRRGLDWAR